MKWLMRLLGLIPVEGRVHPDLIAERRRSSAVLVKAERAIAEEKRIDQLRGSFKRAGGRLGG